MSFQTMTFLILWDTMREILKLQKRSSSILKVNHAIVSLFDLFEIYLFYSNLLVFFSH